MKIYLSQDLKTMFLVRHDRLTHTPHSPGTPTLQTISTLLTKLSTPDNNPITSHSGLTREAKAINAQTSNPLSCTKFNECHKGPYH